MPKGAHEKGHVPAIGLRDARSARVGDRRLRGDCIVNCRW